MSPQEVAICDEHPSFKRWFPEFSKVANPAGYTADNVQRRSARRGYAKYVFKRRERDLRWSLAQQLAAQQRLVEQSEEESRQFEARFRQSANRWRTETKTVSSTTDRALNPAYQDIIGMGERVLPLLFREMQDRGGHWFWALRHITHENPVPPEDAGQIQRMTEAWLRWGRERRYL